ncbi:hypothetical protein RJG79_09125 [Mycoplasmatota bacterium WC44]
MSKKEKCGWPLLVITAFAIFMLILWVYESNNPKVQIEYVEIEVKSNP